MTQQARLLPVPFKTGWLVLGVLLALLLPILPAAAQQSRPDDEITKLAEDVYLFRHQAHQAIFVVTPEGTENVEGMYGYLSQSPTK